MGEVFSDLNATSEWRVTDLTLEYHAVGGQGASPVWLFGYEKVLMEEGMVYRSGVVHRSEVNELLQQARFHGPAAPTGRPTDASAAAGAGAELTSVTWDVIDKRWKVTVKGKFVGNYKKKDEAWQRAKSAEQESSDEESMDEEHADDGGGSAGAMSKDRWIVGKRIKFPAGDTGVILSPKSKVRGASMAPVWASCKQ